MRGRSGRLLAGALSLTMVLGGYAGTGAVAYAETTEGAGTENTVDDTQSDGNRDAQTEDGDQNPAGKVNSASIAYSSQAHFTTDESKNKVLEESASFPKQFDLRSVDTDGDGEGDRCYVTGVKLQNPFSTCWGFAAISAAETSILSSILEDDPEAYKTLDLSEKQLAYFAGTYYDYPGTSQYGEGRHHYGEEPKLTESTLIYEGGLPYLATNTFAAGTGPVDESKDPVLEYRGANGYTDQRMIDGKYQNFSYSMNDDWSMDGTYQLLQEYVLKGSSFLPSPAERDDENNYRYNPAGTAAIKEQLLAKHGVSIGFCADVSSPNQETGYGNYISTKNWAHFTWDEDAVANHAVAIVGWDDDYPKENFPEAHQPEGNGAWLVKNSWGSGEETFPNKGNGQWGLRQGQDKEPYEATSDIHTGYFWLSYYDRSIGLPEALEFDEANQEEGYFLDEYDMMNSAGLECIEFPDPDLRMANVFTAEGNERLKDISFVTQNPETTVKYEVYVLSAGRCDSPEDGVLAVSGEEKFRYGGFHKIHLDTPVLIQKGQHYAIVITSLEDSGSRSVLLPVGSGEKMVGSRSYDVGIVNPGESMVYINGRWEDFADQNLRADILPAIFGEYWDEYAYDNFPIKGFCEVLPNVQMTLTGYSDSLWLYDSARNPKSETEILLRFSGSFDQEMGNPEIRWELAEGGDKIVSLTPAADGSSAKVKALAPGQARVIVTVEGLGFMTTVIRVMQMVPDEIEFKNSEDKSIADNYYVYTGKPIKPDVSLSGFGIELTEGEEYTLEYADNVQCGTGRIKVTAIGKCLDPADPFEKEFYFVIAPPKVTVEEITAGGTSLRAKIRDLSLPGIAGYSVLYREAGTEKWLEEDSYDAGKDVVVKGLKPGTTYEVRTCAAVQMTEDAMFSGMQEYYPGVLSDIVEVTTLDKVYASEWVDGKWYDKDGAQTYAPTGSWKSNKKGKWYEDTAGWYPKNCWQRIDGKEYYFDAKGYAECDAFRNGYYLTEDGSWDGKAKSPGWREDPNGWYYSLVNGSILKDTWKLINGKWYHFGKNGICAVSSFIGGWWIGADGVCRYPYRATWRKNARGWWYGDKSGWYAKGKTLRIDGVEYTFNEKGYLKQ